MKQIIQSFKTGELDLFDVPFPTCSPKGILIKTDYSLISAGTEKMLIDIAKKSLIGKAQSRPDLVKQVLQKMKQEGIKTTLDKVFTKLDTPIPLGYSCSGEVIEVGREVKGISIGERVACGGAGYANHSEYNYIPTNLFSKIPAKVESIEASFVTVGAIALQGIRQANPTLGENIVVLGLGLLGQLTVQMLKANGCRVLGVDLDPFKLSLATKLGADQVCHSSELKNVAPEFSNGNGVDAVLITASSKSDQLMADAGEISKHKGRVVVVGLVGMNVPRDIYYKKELDIRLSMAYGPGRYDPNYEEHGIDYPFAYVRWTEKRNFEAFLNLVAEKKVTPAVLTTHTFDFDDALKAYQLIGGETNENYLGIILKYKTENISSENKIITLHNQYFSSESIKLGLIGAGSFASSITLPRLRKNDQFKFTGVCDNSPVIVQNTGKKFGFNFITTDPLQLINNPEINTVIINTRHNSHAELVIAALKNGKHTFVEKPLCLNMEELEEINKFFTDEHQLQSEAHYKSVNSATQARPILQVGFNRRFSPAIRKMRDIIKDTKVSIIYRVNAGVIPLNTWIQDPQIGGGRVIGELCHFIDTAAFLSNSEVASVISSVISKDDKSIPEEDNISILLSFKNGSTAMIGYYAYGNKSMAKEYIEVFTNGIAMQLFDFRKLIIFKGSKKQVIKSASQDKGFSAEFEAFAAAVKSGIPAISPESLFNSTKTTFAILESVKTNKRIFI